MKRRAIRDMAKSDRPYYRAQMQGEKALSNGELLQLVTGVPYMEACTDLLSKAGNLTNLDRMSNVEIAKIYGLGESSAIAIQAAFELGRRLVSERLERPQIKTPEDAIDLLRPIYGNEEQEHFLVILLDYRSRVIHIEDLYQGTGNTIIIRPSEIFREATRRNAYSIIIAHNHPSGDIAPSPEDVEIAEMLVQAGELIDIGIIDSIIFSKTDSISLNRHGFVKFVSVALAK